MTPNRDIFYLNFIFFFFCFCLTQPILPSFESICNPFRRSQSLEQADDPAKPLKKPKMRNWKKLKKMRRYKCIRVYFAKSCKGHKKMLKNEKIMFSFFFESFQTLLFCPSINHPTRKMFLKKTSILGWTNCPNIWHRLQKALTMKLSCNISKWNRYWHFIDA